MIFGGLLQGYGAFASARAQKDLLSFQAEIGDINARIAERSAQGALRSGRERQAVVRQRGAQVKGAQRARLAANGIDLGSDTAIELQTDADFITENDALAIERDAVAEAWGYRTQSVNQRNEALVSRAAAGAIDGGAAAFGSLLTSAGNVADRWYDFKRVSSNKPPAAQPTTLSGGSWSGPRY